MNLRKQLFKTFQGGAIVRFASLASTLVTSVILARVLGPDEFGIYSYVFAIVTLLALPSQVGIPTLLIRETAKAQAMSDWATMKGLWYWASRVIILTSACIIAMAAIVMFWKSSLVIGDNRWIAVLGLLLVPIIALGNARGAALQGLHHVVLGLIPDSVIRPLALAFFISFAWYTQSHVSAVQAMAWHLAAAFLAFVLGAVFLLKSKPKELKNISADSSSENLWWRAALPLALVSGLQVVSNQIGIVVLGIYSISSEVAFYKVATSASTMSLFGLQIVNMVMGPYIARLHTLGEFGKLQKFASFASLISVATIVPFFIVFLFAGRSIISIVYGSTYTDSFEPLVILVAGQVVNSAYGIVGLLLGMTGNEKQAARWLAVSTAINVGLSILLIPRFGSIGAAIAGAVSLIVWNLAFWRVARATLGVDSSFIYAITHYRTIWRLK